MNMNNAKKFENFLESLKGNGQDGLVESIKSGFQTCFESEEDPHETHWEIIRLLSRKDIDGLDAIPVLEAVIQKIKDDIAYEESAMYANAD